MTLGLILNPHSGPFTGMQTISVGLWNFKDGGSYKARFLTKNQQTQKDFFLD